jgi:hypothetical protein
MEFISPVLSSDTGLDAINDFCRRAGHASFEVNAQCGFHAHFDTRDLSVAQLKSVAYAYSRTYAAWAACVPEARRSNSYCGKHSWGRADLDGICDMSGWRSFAGNLCRYQWINLAAFNVHGTFEVRLHSATLEGEKVCNWVKAHTRFIDRVRNMTFNEIDAFFGQTVKTQFAGLAKTWDDTELTDFYAGRAEKFGTTVTTNITVAV